MTDLWAVVLPVQALAVKFADERRPVGRKQDGKRRVNEPLIQNGYVKLQRHKKVVLRRRNRAKKRLLGEITVFVFLA